MKHRYQVKVDGTGIREFYELDTHHSEEEVAEIWLNDAKAKWGPGVAAVFEERVIVEELTDGGSTPALP